MIRRLLLPALGLVLCACLRKEDYLLPSTGAPERPVAHDYTRTDRASGRVLEYSDRLALPDGRNLKHGVERTWYPSGVKRAERHFDQGRPVGAWRSWHADGSLRSEYEHDPEGRPTAMRFWYPSGQLSAAGPARAGVREGEWTYWYETGVVRQRGPYLGGAREGIWSLYHEDGRLRSRGRYTNDRRVGRWEHGPGPRPVEGPVSGEETP